MKTTLRIFLLAAAVLIGIAAGARSTKGQKVGVSFETTVYEFGNVSEEGEPVRHTFSYTNTGNSPLAILWAKASCGCTTPEYQRKPLKPGEKADIKVTFNPKGQAGEVNKDIRIRFRNGNGKSEEIVLHLKGAVVPKGKNAAK